MHARSRRYHPTGLPVTRMQSYPFQLLSLEVLSFVPALDHYVLHHLRTCKCT